MTKKPKTVADLTPDGRNANKGTERGCGLLENSLRTFGAGRSVLVDRSGNIIAGNKTVEAAGSIGLRDLQVVETQGDVLVAVRRTDLDLQHDAAAKQLAIADNRAGELDLDWDSSVLAELGQEINLEDVGFLSWELPTDTAEDDGTQGGGNDPTDLEDVEIVVGVYHFTVSRERFDDLLCEIQSTVGGDEDAVTKELVGRLGISITEGGSECTK